jgi:NAD(P)-dependent dehydrogenase (short-subunit alcohol dehydrogenase family)
MSTPTFPLRRVLVTGATSGLGLEAAAQLAEGGSTSVVITGRTEPRAEAARTQLVERTSRQVFETLTVDVSDPASSHQAATELIARGQAFDGLILNAGAVHTDLRKTAEGIEMTFAASILGHHLLTTQLIEAGLLTEGARVVIVGSEAANNDLPKMMGFAVHDFALHPSNDDQVFADQFLAFTQGREPSPFAPENQYATTKVVSAWWAAAMQRRHQGTYDFFNVSPGANLGTDAARHMKGFNKVMFSVMGKVGHLVGMNQPVATGAGRYLDVLTGTAPFQPGGTYTSPRKKMTGELAHRTEPHLVDERAQRLALDTLDDLVAGLADDRGASAS